MKINAYLSFPGTCEEALSFYHAVLGGEMLPLMRYEGSPAEAQTPPEWRSKVMHGALEVGDMHLMGSDQSPEHFEKPQGVHLSISVSSADEAERIFAALGEDGNVTMPIGQTFWAERFGMLTDRYGIHWMVSSS